MLQGFIRVIPLLIVAAGVVKGSSLFNELIFGSLKVNTRREVDALVKHIKMDTLSGERAPAPEAFGAYIERNFAQGKKAKARVSDDFWGVAYRLEVGEGEVRVRSAGPDKRFGTTDDITGVVSGLGAEQMPEVAAAPASPADGPPPGL